MSPDPNNDGQRTEQSMADETQTEAEEGNDETGESDPTLSRRSTLVGTALGLTLLSGTSQTAGAQTGQRWPKDVDADGNDLLNLGGLNMDVNAEGTRIGDFEGSNLAIADATLNVTDQLDVDTVDAKEVTAENTVSASAVDADEVNAVQGIATPELKGSVTGGESLRNLVGNNLSIVDNQLTAIDSWQRSGGFLQLSERDISGIEVERIEPPENKNLNVNSSDDLVLSLSGGQGAVRIQTDGGHEIVLDDADGSESLSVEDSAGNSIKMDSATGELSISANEKITLDAPQIDLSADAKLDIESDGLAEIESSGPMNILGAIIGLNGAISPAARKGDSVEDGIITSGSTTVLIGG